MCGLAAVAGASRSVDVAAMTEALRHRGPDDRGIEELGACVLGHQRLSVVDIVGGHQPMSTADGRYWIVFNGEIYNFVELREDLARRGCTFRGHSDTEVVLEGFALLGPRLLATLKGQFAFVAWDQLERRLFAARDRLGEKPLYWLRLPDGGVALASELRSFFARGLPRLELDREALDAYLTLGYVPPDRTIYANVHKVPPAYALSWRDGHVETSRYWEPSYSTAVDVGLEEAASRVRDLLAASVARQARADVEVGAFLSGGLDSSTIVALLAGTAGEGVPTFAAGFGELIDELPYARAVARRYRTEHHEIEIDIDVARMLETMATVFDEPFGDSSAIPTYLLAEFARRRVKVVLSGDGGDVLFGGYEWYAPLQFAAKAPAPLRLAAAPSSLVLRALRRAGVPTGSAADVATLADRAVRARRAHRDPWRRHFAFVSTREEWRSALHGAAAISPPERILGALTPGGLVRGLDRAVDLDVRSYLPGDILDKVDRATMANGLEARAPFLDIDLVEFVLSLPVELRLQTGRTKELLRRAASDLWPAEILARRKQGFGAPMREWLARPEVADLYRRVTASGSPLHELLPGAADAAGTPHETWILLSLGLWLERHTECLV
jgi:asparagine synthase (glutamine-hydrolysing)